MKRTLWISALSAVVLAAGGTLLVRGSGKSDKREAPPVAEAPKPAGGAAEVAKPAEADKPAAPSNAGNTPKPATRPRSLACREKVRKRTAGFGTLPAKNRSEGPGPFHTVRDEGCMRWISRESNGTAPRRL